MDKKIDDNIHFCILGVFILLNILFTSLLYMNGDKVGIGIVILLEVIYTIVLVISKIRYDVSGYLIMSRVILLIFTITSFLAIMSFLKGPEYGWLGTLLTAIIGSLISSYLFYRTFQNKIV